MTSAVTENEALEPKSIFKVTEKHCWERKRKKRLSLCFVNTQLWWSFGLTCAAHSDTFLQTHSFKPAFLTLQWAGGTCHILHQYSNTMTPFKQTLWHVGFPDAHLFFHFFLFHGTVKVTDFAFILSSLFSIEQILYLITRKGIGLAFQWCNTYTNKKVKQTYW